jgi:hypothetical protein
MILVKIIIIAIVCVLCLGVYASQTAVEGYEDADGFHYGKQVKK